MKPLLHAWASFAETPMGELVTGSAHQAHPTDITLPLGVRFAGQTILAVHVALEKAATVRVAFDSAGTPRLSGIRNIKQRTSSEFSEVLRSEAVTSRASWAVVVLATGWQAVLGQRAARPDANDSASAFSRHRLMMETPEVVVPRAQPDRVYTAVDHPVLDKSVVFSVRRAELDQIVSEVQRCRLGIAAVRIAVAAQLETWLSSTGEGGLTRDLLFSDGLSALLLNIEQGDFVPPRGAVETEQPRQAVQRPGTVEEDIARFVHANERRSIAFVGPEELCVGIKKRAPDAELIRLPENPAHDTQRVALLPMVQHDLNFEAREVRPVLHRRWRRIFAGYCTVVFVLGAASVFNGFYAAQVGYRCYQLERDAVQRTIEAEADRSAVAKMAVAFSESASLRAWVGTSFHAQRFCYRLLKDIPAAAAIDKLQVEWRDGQLALTVVVLGDADAQLAAHRAIENAITGLRYKIAGEELPVAVAGAMRGFQYRLHVIVPDAAEVAAL